MNILNKQVNINNIPDDFLSLINEFRSVDITLSQKLFSFIETLPNNHHIYVIYDNDTNETIGSFNITSSDNIYQFSYKAHNDKDPENTLPSYNNMF